MTENNNGRLPDEGNSMNQIENAYADQLFDSSPLAFVLLDTHDNIVRINAEFTNVFGYTFEEIAGRPLDALIAAPEKREEAALLTKATRNGERMVFETERRKKDGSPLLVEILAKPITIANQRIGILGIYRDITKRKHEERLKETLFRILETSNRKGSSEEIFKALLGNLTHIIQGELYTISIRENDGQIVHHTFAPSVPDESPVLPHAMADFVHHVFSNGEVARAQRAGSEWTDRTIPGGIDARMNTWFAVPVQVVDFRQGVLAVFSEHTHDAEETLKTLEYLAPSISTVIDRKHAEEALIKSKADLQELVAQKNLFLSILSHDLRSPFTATLGYAELLAYEKDLSMELVHEYAEAIRSSVERQVALASRLLEWSRLETGRTPFHPKEFELSFVVEGITTMLKVTASNKNISLTSDVDPQLFAYGDDGLVFQVLTNLINNAIKFTPLGGGVVVKAERKEHNEIVVSVHDSGIGISDDTKEKLFRYEKLYTTRGTQGEYGTGLGLSICKRIVDMHEGKIWIESEVGLGTTISFTLPGCDKSNAAE